MQDVLSNQLKPIAVARLNDIPRSTLVDMLSGIVIHGTKPGPKSYLAAAEEKELTGHLVDAVNIKLAKKSLQLLRGT